MAIDRRIVHKPGTSDYLHAYPGAVTEVLNQLSEERKDEYRKLAMEWNKAGPPREVQLK
jgi:hypothetical protein